MKVWIISASTDADFVRRLRSDLEHEGLSVASAVDTVRPGESIAARLLAAPEESDAIILVLSSASTKSQWVAMETAIAVDARLKASHKTIVPVLAEPRVTPPVLVQHLLYLDLSTPDRYKENLPKLVNALANPSPPIAHDAELRAQLEHLRFQRRLLDVHLAARKQARLVQSWAIFTAVISIAAGALVFVTAGFSFLGLTLEYRIPSGFVTFASGALAGVGSVLFTVAVQRRLQRDEIRRLHDQVQRMERFVLTREGFQKRVEAGR